MGADRNENGGSKNKRGSTDNAGRLAGILGTRVAGTGGADWGGCRADWMQAVVVAVARVGGAVSFGYSRDGGAYSLGIMLDGERKTLWFNGDADLDEELEKVFHAFETV